jgi:hypothetical protein
MYLPGQWSFDAAMSKKFQIRKSKSLQLRVDATNILNHPVPNNPTLDINSMNVFGFIQDKGNQRREFKGMQRDDPLYLSLQRRRALLSFNAGPVGPHDVG